MRCYLFLTLLTFKCVLYLCISVFLVFTFLSFCVLFSPLGFGCFLLFLFFSSFFFSRPAISVSSFSSFFFRFSEQAAAAAAAGQRSSTGFNLNANHRAMCQYSISQVKREADGDRFTVLAGWLPILTLSFFLSRSSGHFY